MNLQESQKNPKLQNKILAIYEWKQDEEWEND